MDSAIIGVMQLPTQKQRAQQRKILKEVSEVLHKSRLKQASWIERLILNHIERKHK